MSPLFSVNNVVLGLLACSLTACGAPSPSDNGSVQNVAENLPAVADPAPSKKFVLTSKPLTMHLTLNARLRNEIEEALANSSERTVRLTVKDVVPPAARESLDGISIFVNKADATRKTPDNDAHALGPLDFEATTERDPQNFVVDMTDTLRDLRDHQKLDLSKPLRFTLIAHPKHGTFPDNFSIPIKELTVSVHGGKKSS